MLSKQERLKRVDFSRFFSLGRRFQHKYFTLIYSTHPEIHSSVVVSKKVAQKAVIRNRVRRRIYDTLRRYIRKNHVTGVYIILVKKEALLVSVEELNTALTTVMQRVK